jgi:hypothetical protein
VPPCIDIYCLTRSRNRETIERFLDEFVDRPASEDRQDEELMMVPLGLTDYPQGFDKCDWQPAKTLSNIILRGLELPFRAFAVYLKSKSASFNGASLCFTVEGQLVLGLSLDDPDGDDANIDRAESIMRALAESYSAHLALAHVEEPPPRSEKAFLDVMRNETTLIRWDSDATTD